MDLTEHARTAYTEMVQQLEKEQQENPNRHAGSVPPFCAHMGHSRTPSACSAISFTSSILSEPISENYPQSEPETDSRGYEIIREALIRDSDVKRTLANTELAGRKAGAYASEGTSTSGAMMGGMSQDSIEKVTIIESLDDIDEVHNEDMAHSEGGRRRSTGKACHIRRESDGEDGDDEGGGEDEDEEEEEDSEEEGDDEDDTDSASSNNDDETEYDRDTVRELPHIDSIHSSVVDLSTEILSQHPSKNPDLVTEAFPVHSSGKNRNESPNAVRPATLVPQAASLGSCAGNPVASAQLDKDVALTNGDVASGDAVAGSVPAASSTHKMRSVNKERIESWVAETQQCIDCFSVHEALPASKDKASAAADETGGLTQNGRSPARASPAKTREDSVNGRSDPAHESRRVCDVHPQQQAS